MKGQQKAVTSVSEGQGGVLTSSLGPQVDEHIPNPPPGRGKPGDKHLGRSLLPFPLSHRGLPLAEPNQYPEGKGAWQMQATETSLLSHEAG